MTTTSDPIWLASQHRFVLDRDRWEAFVAALEQPVRPDPRLTELFARPDRIN